MSIKFTKFVKGIMLETVTTDALLTEEGAIYYKDGKIKGNTGGEIREVVTDSDTQTLTEKTLTSPNINGGTIDGADITNVTLDSIDADNTTISNLETDNFKTGVIDTDPTLTADSDTVIPTQKAIKQFVADSISTKDEASEIAFNNSTNGFTGDNVQTAIEEVADDLFAHEQDTTTHGTTGDIVGTSDVQDLSNKAIIDPSRLDVYKDTLTNLETYAATAGNGQLCFDTTNNKMYQIVDNKLKTIGGGGATYDINQTDIGTIGMLQAIYNNGTSWVKAQADDINTTATHIISEIIDDDNVVAMQFGHIEYPNHNQTVGAYYFLTNFSDGDSLPSEPTSGFSCPVYFVPDANNIIAMVYRPSVIGNQVALDDLADVSASTPSNGEGLVFNSTSGAWEAIDIVTQTELTTHEADTSVHGVTTVVGLDEIQTLTNKTLTSPVVNTADINGGTIDGSVISDSSIITPNQMDVKQDTLTNLETYATTATDGQVVFATDEKKMYQIVDHELVNIGSGSAGDTSIYSLLDNDNTKVNKWTTTGLTSGATFVDNTTDQLSGKSDYLYSTDTNNADNCYINIPVPVRSRAEQSSMHKIEFPYIQTGTEGTIQIELYDVTSSASIKTIDLLNKNNRFTGSFTMPVGCEEIRVIIGSVTNGVATLQIDQITLSDKFGEYGSVTVSETITYTGLDGLDGGLTKYKDVLTNTSDKLMSVTNSGHTIVTFDKVSPFTASASASVSTGSGDVYMRIEHYDKFGVIKIITASNTASSEYGLSASMVGIAEQGDYLVTASGANTGDNIYTNFSVTATAQSDTVQFEDSYQQAHHVGKAVYNLSSHSITTSTAYTLPALTLTSSLISGNLEQNTINAPSITVKDCKVGTLEIRVTGKFGNQNEINTEFTISNGVTNYSEQGGYGSYLPSFVFDVPIDVAGDIDLDFKLRSVSSTNIISSAIPLEISVSYLPPVEQASTTRMLAVKSSLENDFDVDASDAGVLSNFNGAEDWCSFVNITDTSKFNYVLNTDVFTSGVFPDIDPSTFGAADGKAEVYYGSFPNFIIVTKNAGSNLVLGHTIRAKKRGADRSDRHTPVVNGDDVVKEQIAIISPTSAANNYKSDIPATTSYKVRSLDHFVNTFSGISISNDQLTLSSGKYVVDFPMGAHNGNNWMSLLVNNVTDSAIHIEIEDVTHSAAAVVNFNSAVFIIDISETKVFEFLTKSDNATSNEYIGRIIIRKIL